MRPIIVWTAALLLLASPAPAFADGYPSGRFEDDDRHPAEVALEALAGWGVIDGCDPPANSRSCPDSAVSRAEAAKIIVELGGARGVLAEPGRVVPDRFLDDGSALGGGAEQYLDRLAAIGALHGCDPPVNRLVCPDAGVTRGEAAKILVAAYGLEGAATVPWDDVEGRFYADSAGVAARHGMWADRARFDGEEPITRGELAMEAVRAAGSVLCRPNPFTQARREEVARRYPGQSITAHVYDTRTRCHYRLNESNRQSTASLFKVMVMAGTLLEAQNESRNVTAWELGQLEPMITESANGPVRSLWWSFGGSPWFRTQGRIFGLADTTVRGDDGSAWGLTQTSAADQVDLLRQVLIGEWGPIENPGRAVALDLMTSVVASQTWGVTAGVPDGWTVAQKNGFAGVTINSVGWVDDPGPGDGYVVAILTRGWSDHPSGIEAVEWVNEWIALAMTE